MLNKTSMVRMITKGSLTVILLIMIVFTGYAQDSGYIWIKAFSPGSADLKDASIDKDALSFVDSLMKRDDINVIFLGGSDNVQWKQADGKKTLSNAWDEGKKLERARQLRMRYGRGDIGLTDEPVRGIKVVWGPRTPDIIEMKDDLTKLQNEADSLRKEIYSIKDMQNDEFGALKDSLLNIEPASMMTSISEISTSNFDWEVMSGMLYWSAGAQYRLTVPYLGLALKREFWGVQLQGGFTPWSLNYTDGYGRRGDAFLMGTFNIYLQDWYDWKFGVLSGWKYLTASDNWTMKVVGLTTGPNFRVKFLNLYLGYNLGNLSTMTEPGRWVHSACATVTFNLKLNKW